MPTESHEATLLALPVLDAAHKTILEATRDLAQEEDPKLLSIRLDRLHRVLEGHFAEEEGEGGLFERIATKHPGAGPSIAILKEQHREILAALDEARATVDVGSEYRPDDALRARTALVDRIRAHESQEGRLLSDVTNLELGGPGGG